MAATVQGRVQGVFVGRDFSTLVTAPEPALTITWAGIEGDRHAGLTRRADSRTPHFRRGTQIRNTRQVSLVSEEELEIVAQALGLPGVLPEWLGANVAVAGIPHLTRLPPSTRLFFSSGAVLVVEGENLPCRGPGRVLGRFHPEVRGLVSRFTRAALGQRGLVAWVERPGVIRPGDEVRAVVPDLRPYPPGNEGKVSPPAGRLGVVEEMRLLGTAALPRE